MNWLVYVSYSFGGVFFANAVPHLVSGMMGRAFQSPFAKPPGKGLSSSTVNVVWGAFNVVVGYLLIWRVGSFDVRDTGDAVAVAIGGVLVALQLARHFGALHGGNTPRA